MNDTSTTHLTGKICWLPHHNPEKPSFPPAVVFRALAKFTSNFDPSYTVLVSYSPNFDNENCFAVRLAFPFANTQDLEKLAAQSEILIMDSYKVLAICRNLVIFRSDEKLDAPW